MAQRSPQTPTVSSGWRTVAIVYTVVGGFVVAALALLPDSELAMVVAIVGALPLTLCLMTLELTPGVAQLALLIIAIAWLANAAALWWLALRRRA